MRQMTVLMIVVAAAAALRCAPRETREHRAWIEGTLYYDAGAAWPCSSFGIAAVSLTTTDTIWRKTSSTGAYCFAVHAPDTWRLMAFDSCVVPPRMVLDGQGRYIDARDAYDFPACTRKVFATVTVTPGDSLLLGARGLFSPRGMRP